MKKILIFCLSLFLAFSFCKKSGSETEEEDDRITLEITVNKNGSPAQNIFVEVEATVWESVVNRDSGMHTDSYETAKNDDDFTNIYGKATFTYNKKSIPSRNGIVIEKITIKEGYTIVHEDDQEKVIQKNGSLSLSYDI